MEHLTPTTMRLIVGIALALSLATTVQAQPQAGTGGATASATIVQTGAGAFDLATLSPISQDELPTVGTFYLASGGPPMPCPFARFGPNPDGADPALATAPIYVIDAQRRLYLVDDRATVALRMLAQSQSPSLPIPGGGGGGIPGGAGAGGAPQYLYQTNDFWLEPVSIASNLFNVILHGATNGSTYLITSTEEVNPLAASTWLVEGSLQASNDGATPFALGIATRTNSLFIRAQGCDECATTTLPLAWQLAYFGVTGVDPNADYDNDGVNNLAEYLGGTDPNKISFSISVTNQYVNTTAVPVQLNIANGVPSYIAMLVNDTNAADANWQPLTSNCLSLPTPADGVYVVTVGLCGLATNATQTWQSLTIFRDTTPLTLVLTNPVPRSGSRPFIDPAGYATRALRAITWTVFDADGGTRSGGGGVVAQGWNLANPYLVTNWFQCVDLALALGTNSVSIQAVDWAGNVAMTNFAYVFDTNGDTTPPALALLWPQDGTQVSGNNFTVQAWMDDDTATVALQYTDTGGIVQTMNGLVERGGNLWVEGVPLVPGTNLLALTATDAAGNVSTTNFSVVQSGVALTVAPLSQDQMKYGSATVMVTVGGSASTVTVNGLPGTSSDGQSWQVNNVPLPPGGTVALQATAWMADGTVLQNLLEQEREPVVFTQVFDYKVHYTLSAYRSECGGTWTALRDIPFHWVRGSNCASSFIYSEFEPCTGNTATHEDALTWPADKGYLASLPGQRVYNDYVNGQLWHSFTESQDPAPVERVDISTSSGSWPSNYNANWSEGSGVEVRLFTGGKALRQGQGLFDLSASLAYADCLDTAVSSWCESSYLGLFLWLDSPPVAVPSEDIALGGLGNLGSDGHLWTVQPDGVEVVVTPQVFSSKSSSAPASSPVVATGTRGGLPGEQKYKLRIYFGDQNVTDTNVDVVVGQGITLSCCLVSMQGGTPPPITNYLWTIPGYAVSNFYVAADVSTGMVMTPFPLTNASARFYWVDGGGKEVRCRAIVEGGEMTAEATFDVARPTIDWVGSITSPVTAGGDDTGLAYVRFGSTITNELGYIIVLNGIECLSSNSDLAGYGGPYGFLVVQVLTGGGVAVTLADGTTTSIPANGLDNSYPTADIGTGDDGLYADAPGASARPAVSLADASSYRTVLMFEPEGMDAIPVPIKEILWNYSGQVTTNATGGWTVSNCNSNISVNNHDTLVFPYWTNVFKNMSLSH